MTTPNVPATTAPPASAIVAAAKWETLPKGLPRVRGLLDVMRGEFTRALPKCGLTTERLIRLVTTLLSATDRKDGKSLVDCTALSVVGGVMAAAQLGLEVGGALGQAYLVPHRDNRSGELRATFIPGYRGMIDLARRSGSVSVIDAVAVHKRDKFRVVLGINPTIEHEPFIGKGEDKDADDAGPLRAVYARCLMRDATTQFVVMTKHEVESVRLRSKAGGDGPWQTDYDEMAKKTCIRRLWKVLPVSVEKAMAKAIEAHDRAEAGDPIDASGIILDSGDIFGSNDDAATPGEVSGKTDAPTAEVAKDAKSSARRTRRTVIDATPSKQPDPNDPTPELLRVHERIRQEDPEAFAAGWKITVPEGADAAKVVADFTLTGFGVDALVAARDEANAFAKANPLPDPKPKR